MSFNYAADKYFQIYIYMNGSSLLSAAMGYRDNDGTVNANVGAGVFLSPGDYLELYANTYDSAAFTLYGGTVGDSHFGMVRIGPMQ
jgi:hypothetical protein